MEAQAGKENKKTPTSGAGQSRTNAAADSSSAPASNGSLSDFGQKAPSVSLPKGGGAIRGMGEKFSTNPVTGTCSLSIPLPISPGRGAKPADEEKNQEATLGFAPSLSLGYDSGSGNGIFGLGWSLGIPQVSRKTDKGIPRYGDESETDVFLLSGAEDLVVVEGGKLTGESEEEIVDNGQWIPESKEWKVGTGTSEYRVRLYRPRTEGLFARIERWRRVFDGATHWRSISKENITSVFGSPSPTLSVAEGEGPMYQIRNPEKPGQVYAWLLHYSFDDKGNVMVYEYTSAPPYPPEVTGHIFEKHRTEGVKKGNRFISRILYGNKTFFDAGDPLPAGSDFVFSVRFDYGALPSNKAAEAATQISSRNDPYSSYKSGFELRTWALCRRVLMYHHFTEYNGLVKSLELEYDEFRTYSLLNKATQYSFRKKDDGTYAQDSLPPLEFSYTQQGTIGTRQTMDPESLRNLPIGMDGSQYRWMDLFGEGIQGMLTEQGGGWYYKRGLGLADKGLPGESVQFASLETLREKPAGTGLSNGSQQFMDLAGDGTQDLVQLTGPGAGFYEMSVEPASDGKGGYGDRFWLKHRPLKKVLNLNTNDPHVKMMDASGDGLTDIVVSDLNYFTVYQSLGEEGFEPGKRVYKTEMGSDGPKVVFGDPTQTVFLADISGDGLADLVQVRNGSICYWPNLGHGRFGKRVTMANVPQFDSVDRFDPKRIRFADLDGTGPNDLLYFGKEGVQMWVNESGNSLASLAATPHPPSGKGLIHLPPHTQVDVVDLKGDGTSCLVWSSSLPAHSGRQLQYIDLFPDGKPFLLESIKNNLGAETKIHYKPSTYFYLKDKKEGRPWATRLHFPVQTVERVETLDSISKNYFVSRYAYHHGYFDGPEREFRGFGMVEQWDTEEMDSLDSGTWAEILSQTGVRNWDTESHVPPVLTRTWYHTGAYLDGKRLEEAFAREYWKEPSLSPAQQNALRLPDTVIPDAITTPEERRQAVRALRGQMLRQEIYALDGTAEEAMPYQVTEKNYSIRMLQGIPLVAGTTRQGQYGVFHTTDRESLQYQYERGTVLKTVPKPGGGTEEMPFADPRVVHTLLLETNPWGQETKSLTVSYGRRWADEPELREDVPPAPVPPNPFIQDKSWQTRNRYLFSEKNYTNPVGSPNDWRTPAVWESTSWEVYLVDSGEWTVDNWVALLVGGKFGAWKGLVDFEKAKKNLTPNPSPGERDFGDYEPLSYWETNGRAGLSLAKRLVEHERVLYRKDDLSGLCAWGVWESKSLPGESYRLAFTDGLLTHHLKKGGTALLLSGDFLANGLVDNSGYTRMSGDAGGWWVPSGKVYYKNSGTDIVGDAEACFYQPLRYVDAFGNETKLTFDGYKLFPLSTEDAHGNTVSSEYNFRVLQPWKVTDPNLNVSEALFDTMGRVAALAVKGKVSPANETGDDLKTLENGDLPADVSLADLQTLANGNTESSLALLQSLLGKATSRMVYDQGHYHRVGTGTPLVYSISRETHIASLASGETSKVQVALSCSDGLGREIQKKMYAGTGVSVQITPASTMEEGFWNGSNPREKAEQLIELLRAAGKLDADQASAFLTALDGDETLQAWYLSLITLLADGYYSESGQTGNKISGDAFFSLLSQIGLLQIQALPEWQEKVQPDGTLPVPETQHLFLQWKIIGTPESYALIDQFGRNYRLPLSIDLQIKILDFLLAQSWISQTQFDDQMGLYTRSPGTTNKASGDGFIDVCILAGMLGGQDEQTLKNKINDTGMLPWSSAGEVVFNAYVAFANSNMGLDPNALNAHHQSDFGFTAQMVLLDALLAGGFIQQTSYDQQVALYQTGGLDLDPHSLGLFLQFLNTKSYIDSALSQSLQESLDLERPWSLPQITAIFRALIVTVTVSQEDRDLFQAAFDLAQEPNKELLSMLAKIAGYGHSGGKSGNDPGQGNQQIAYSHSYGVDILEYTFPNPESTTQSPEETVRAMIIALMQGAAMLQDWINSHRWLTSGWQIFNNKGKVVRQFEPFFSASPLFESSFLYGVSPILCYDPLGRTVATLHPDRSWEKVEFTPWKQQSWDRNDTASLTMAQLQDDAVAGPFALKIRDWKSGDLWGHGTENQANTLQHHHTPSTAFLDPLGKPFLTVAHNRKPPFIGPEWDDEFIATREYTDLEGNRTKIIDGLGRESLLYFYDMLQRPLRTESIDGGRRWMLTAVDGQPVRRWDDRGSVFAHAYDALRRPTEMSVHNATVTPAISNALLQKTEYGDVAGMTDRAAKQALNQIGQLVKSWDTAGLVEISAYTYQGKPLNQSRRVWAGKTFTAWPATEAARLALVDSTAYATGFKYDALGRVTLQRNEAENQTIYTYNQTGQLFSVKLETLTGTLIKWFVKELHYNAKGQRTNAKNGDQQVNTVYTYDQNNFRLLELKSSTSTETLQWLVYEYDAVGNIVSQQDKAQPTLFFANVEVQPKSKYLYDPLYRLVEAKGREHLAIAGPPTNISENEAYFSNNYASGGALAWGNYTETYAYDKVGNLMNLKHDTGTADDQSDFTRTYTYPSDSNKLSKTKVSNQPEVPYSYDAHGNINSMPHLTVMQWDVLDRLEATATQAGSNPPTTCYLYDSQGNRVRKSIWVGNQLLEERIYAGGFEIYRTYAAGSVTLERFTTQIMDDQSRIGMLDRQRVGGSDELASLVLANHLGSSQVVLDLDSASVIQYEEYHPFGSCAYQATLTGSVARRYRFCGKERDEESGLYYYGARYYASWLGRFVSVDALKDKYPQWSSYQYTGNNPVTFYDLDGNEPADNDNTNVKPPVKKVIGTPDATNTAPIITPKPIKKEINNIYVISLTKSVNSKEVASQINSNIKKLGIDTPFDIAIPISKEDFLKMAPKLGKGNSVIVIGEKAQDSVDLIKQFNPMAALEIGNNVFLSDGKDNPETSSGTNSNRNGRPSAVGISISSLNAKGGVRSGERAKTYSQNDIIALLSLHGVGHNLGFVEPGKTKTDFFGQTYDDHHHDSQLGIMSNGDDLLAAFNKKIPIDSILSAETKQKPTPGPNVLENSIRGYRETVHETFINRFKSMFK